ncbi:MAG: energy transducer TonB [Methylococcaceae bacterium]
MFFLGDDNKLLNSSQGAVLITPSKVRLIRGQRYNFVVALAFLTVLCVHLGVMMYLSNHQETPPPPKPVVVEVALLQTPKPVVAIAPPAPAPEPVKKVEPIKPQPPKPKPTPVKAKPVVAKPLRLEKAVLTTAAASPVTIAEPAPALSPPKVESPVPAPAPVIKPVEKINKVVDNAAERSTCVSCPQLDYPAIAKRRQWQGSVKLRLHINSDGSVANAQVIESSGHEALDDYAVEGAKQWQFNAGVAGRSAQRTINFKLETE